MNSDNNEIERAVANLRMEPQITQKQFFGLVGMTTDGKFTVAPDSYQRGFQYELTQEKNRPVIVLNLGVIAFFSDGNINFMPSFNEGRNKARDVKVNLVAQYAINTKQEFTDFKHNTDKKIEDLTQENIELQKRLKELEEKKKKD